MCALALWGTAPGPGTVRTTRCTAQAAGDPRRRSDARRLSAVVRGELFGGFRAPDPRGRVVHRGRLSIPQHHYLRRALDDRHRVVPLPARDDPEQLVRRQDRQVAVLHGRPERDRNQLQPPVSGPGRQRPAHASPGDRRAGHESGRPQRGALAQAAIGGHAHRPQVHCRRLVRRSRRLDDVHGVHEGAGAVPAGIHRRQPAHRRLRQGLGSLAAAVVVSGPGRREGRRQGRRAGRRHSRIRSQCPAARPMRRSTRAGRSRPTRTSTSAAWPRPPSMR